MDSGPPRARGGSSAPELQGRRGRCPYGPRSRYRPAPEASTLPPLGAAARLLLHPHPCSLWPSAPAPLAPGSTRRGRTHKGRQHDPNPRPFTTPLRLQTVTVATNLSAASRVPAGPGRGARSLAPPLPGPALRTWSRPRDPAHVPIGPRRRPAPRWLRPQGRSWA